MSLLQNLKENQFPCLELLNFEGPVLTAIKVENNFVIIDQWNKLCSILTFDQMLHFIYEYNSITDSSGKKWIYPKESKEAKPKEEILLDFLSFKN